MKNSKRKYLLREKYNHQDLLDGRAIKYLSSKIDFNREYTSLILRGKRRCTYDIADKIIKALSLQGSVDDYFYIVEYKECEPWKKTQQN